MIILNCQMIEATTKKGDQSMGFWHQINESDDAIIQGSMEILHMTQV